MCRAEKIEAALRAIVDAHVRAVDEARSLARSAKELIHLSVLEEHPLIARARAALSEEEGTPAKSVEVEQPYQREIKRWIGRGEVDVTPAKKDRCGRCGSGDKGLDADYHCSTCYREMLARAERYCPHHFASEDACAKRVGFRDSAASPSPATPSEAARCDYNAWCALPRGHRDGCLSEDEAYRLVARGSGRATPRGDR